MKKHTAIIATLVVTVVLLTLGLVTSPSRTANRFYPAAAIVTEVNKTDNYIVATNYTRTFVIYETTDWEVGDYVSILLDNKRTVSIIDDAIVDYRYTELERTEDEGLWFIHTTHRP